MFDSIFNHCVLGFSIAHASHYGLFEKIENEGQLSILKLSADLNCAEPIVLELCRILSQENILSLNQSTVAAGPKFEEALRKSGYFEWLLIGYGGLLATPKQQPISPLQLRNSKAIANGSSKIGAYDIDPILVPYIQSKSPTSVSDLGCGTGQRIIQLALANPDLHATGIDIDPKAVELAKANVLQNQLQDRITILKGDASKIDLNLYSTEKSVVLMSFMGHDMWPSNSAHKAFSLLRECFSQCEHFIMSDTVRRKDDIQPRIFSQGFELTHSLMNKYIPSISEWEQLFLDTHWKLQNIEPLGVPNTYIFDLTPN